MKNTLSYRFCIVKLLVFFFVLGSFCCNTVQSISNIEDIPIPDVTSLLKTPSPITTSFADTKAYTNVPAIVWNAKKAQSLNKQPRSKNGGYLLRPGFYQMTCKSYCLQAGTYGPGKGDGYLYAPLKGNRKDIIQTLVRNATNKKEIEQATVQMLIWAVLAKTSFKNLSTDLQLAAAQLLTPAQLFQLNGGALGILPASVLEKVSESLPEPIQKGMAVENEMRNLFQQTAASYQDFERLAVLTGSTAGSKELRQGAWSEHPNGYFVRYFPDGYRSTKVQVYVPQKTNSQAKLKATSDVQFASLQTENNLVEYDATENVAVPADSDKQRLGQSNDPADGGNDGGSDASDAGNDANNSNNNPPPYNPCDVINNPSDPTQNPTLSPEQQEIAKQTAEGERIIAESKGWEPDKTPFDTPDDAAKAAIYYINKSSIQQNIEYAGRIYQDPQTGHYYFSNPVKGSRDNSDPSHSPIPPNAKVVATYHTHSGEYKASDEHYSPDDILKSLMSHLPSYLGTPQGKLLKFDPNKNQSSPCPSSKDLGTMEVLQ